ncbi:MAG: hydroxymethylglutaryl-CoA reductase (NADPH) [Candidatus Helarchaeota archaeon]|nr:hydroxymethylglutaryl-CoA reductase (NADPH) [Candidatus Helarchaeota archaeon]
MNEKEILQKLKKKEIRLHEVEEYTEGDINKATKIRRKFLEEITNTNLENIGSYSIDISMTAARNIENPIGIASLPLGIAGPLKVNGEVAQGEFFLPLATTEGALVASVNRGCSVITKSGGATVRVIKNLMARAPVLKIIDPPFVENAQKLVNWVQEKLEDLKKLFLEVDQFAFLKEIQSWIIGRTVFLRFLVFPADAMGMNMITTGSEKACHYIAENCPVTCELIATSGNMCVDKKASALNYILGRGKTVQAEVILERKLIVDVLKTTPEAMEEVVYRKIYLGTGQAAAYGLNSHVANILAAMFIATGQDPAQVVEGSMGIVSAEILEDGNLYFSLLLPSLEIGTTGGGTHLPTQREALSIMDCYGYFKDRPAGMKSQKLGEIITAAALAGEVSLCGALAAGHLASSHERLGRGKKS